VAALAKCSVARHLKVVGRKEGLPNLCDLRLCLLVRRASNSKKTSVSANKRRRCIDSKPKAPPSRKGIRHPYVANRSCVIPVLRVLATNEPSRIPPVSPPVKIPQAMPTFDGSTCSLTKTNTPGTWPPRRFLAKSAKATVRRAPRYPV
jgi:hypothetical protein